MPGSKGYLVIAVATAFIALGPAPGIAKEDSHRGGHVMKCSLHGVNPAHHPDIFGNADAAKAYGFVQSDNGKWHVMPGCRRHGQS
jgi:hypothetical protein